jgi:hypothetical protein
MVVRTQRSRLRREERAAGGFEIGYACLFCGDAIVEASADFCEINVTAPGGYASSPGSDLSLKCDVIVAEDGPMLEYADRAGEH